MPKALILRDAAASSSSSPAGVDVGSEAPLVEAPPVSATEPVVSGTVVDAPGSALSLSAPAVTGMG